MGTKSYLAYKYRVDYSKLPFFVENASGGGVNLVIKKMGSWRAPTITIEYSTDNSTWNTLGETSDEGLTLNLSANERVYLRGVTDSWASSSNFNKYNKFECYDKINVGGNIMSLLYGSNFENRTTFPTSDGSIFYRIFFGTSIVDASKLILPVTTLNVRCYDSMFIGCTSLTTAPALPATTLAQYCYTSMFQGCTSLTSAPALPAITLADYCYFTMFWECSSITTAPALPATSLAYDCYESMFYECTSLTTAPALPATTLVQSCYASMFSGCTSLNDVTIYADDISATNCLSFWLYNVAKTGTFHNHGTATYLSGESGIPSLWTEVRPTKGTGWTPDDPIDVTGDELEQMLDGDKKAESVKVGYFYNVTVASKAFKVGVYVVTDPNTAVAFDEQKKVSQKELNDLAGKGLLSVGAIYYIVDSEEVVYASTSSSYNLIQREPPTPPKGSGWTPDDPIDVTGEELEQMLNGGKKLESANVGYFYNVTSKGKTYNEGLYVVVDPNTAVTFDKSNMMNAKALNDMANKGALSKGVVYYVTDSESVVVASSSSSYDEIQRENPEPKGSGWTPDDPIEMSEEDFSLMCKEGKALQGYFYLTPKSMYVMADVYTPIQFDYKSNVMDRNGFDELAKKGNLKVGSAYYITDSEQVFVATSTSTYDEISRTAPKGEQPMDIK